MIIGMAVNSLFKTILGSVNGRLASVKIERWHYFVFAFGSLLVCIVSMPFIIWLLFGEKFRV